MIAMAANLAAMAPMSSEKTFCEGKIAADCVRMGFACVILVSMRTVLPVFLGKLLPKGLDGWRSYGTRLLVCAIGIPVTLYYAMNILPDELLEARHFAIEGAALHSTGARVFSPILHVFYVCMTLFLNEMVRLYAEIWRMNFLRRPLIMKRVIASIALTIILQNNFIDIRRCRVCGLVGCAIVHVLGEFVFEFFERMYNTYANRVHRVAATLSQSPLQDSLHR